VVGIDKTNSECQFIIGGDRCRVLVTEAYVELHDIPVMRVRADMKGGGPAAAMTLLESKLPTLKGRKFYGVYRERPDGEEYYACVAKVGADDPEKMQVETGVIPGGRFVRRKVLDWERVIREGRLPLIFGEMVKTHSHEIDPDRFSIEFYRSQTELLVFLPVKGF
jgi:hypothetical protein